MSEWFVYILECIDGTFYTGISSDVMRRVLLHNKGRGAKYTRGRRPVVLVWKLAVGTKSRALKVEYQVKQLTRRQKKDLINGKVLHSNILSESS